MVANTECNLRVSMQQAVAIDSIKSSLPLRCLAFCVIGQVTIARRRGVLHVRSALSTPARRQAGWHPACMCLRP
jgi:hypothetical protein